MTRRIGGASPFDSHPLLIARMDQLARNEDLQPQLRESEWDLVIVDEAHRMGAHYFGGELRKTKGSQINYSCRFGCVVLSAGVPVTV